MSTVATAPAPTGIIPARPSVTEQSDAAEEQRRRRLEEIARRHGMTVPQWLDHCDALEAEEDRLRSIERTMQHTPRYREGVAA